MRRFVPWLLLGVLGLVTGLGLGLGLAYEPTETEPPTAATETPALVTLVPSWLPPGFAHREPRNPVIFGYSVEGRCEGLNGFGFNKGKSFTSPSGTQELVYFTSPCDLTLGPSTQPVRIGERSVTFTSNGHGTVWAQWREEAHIHVLLAAVNVPRSELVRFIAGLRVAYASYLHHR